jgi:hypothetical protein
MAMQIPCWHICEELQETPQSPQFVRSVMISEQLAPHIWRSDGQTTAFTGVGLVPGISGIVVLSDRFSVGTGVGPGEGGSVILYDVTTGVTRVSAVTGCVDDGSKSLIPEFVMMSKIAIITITASTAPVMIFSKRFGSGCPPAMTWLV